MIIRKAKKPDLENIMKMYKSCVTGMLRNGIDQWDETYPNTEIISQDLNVGTYYVAEMDKTIISGINIDKNQDPTYLDIDWKDKSDSFLVVHRLGVKEEFWNKRIGKDLMLFTEKLVIEKGLKSIRLDTYSGNPKAMEFYRRIGYTELGTIDLKPDKEKYYCFEKIIK
ncbi:MAG: GNAT family N-acetyltransferase [Flavobacteriales bacterium]|jgi:ribosomal protein S18 acetylase RimI-like enzyme|nr:GNAT family N-acetyltransferase [Flavobacteriales bacterium]